MNNKMLDRRSLLNLMCKGFASSLILPSLMSQSALAQTAVNNRKILFVYNEGGATSRFMDMRPQWSAEAAADNYDIHNFNLYGLTPDNAEWEFRFTDPRMTEDQMSRVLRPLWRHRSQLTYLEGLAMTSTGTDVMAPASMGDGHAQAHIGCMSGTSAAYAYDGVKSHCSTVSMDQRINDFIKRTNPNHRSLNYRPGNQTRFHEFLYYDAGNGNIQRLPVEVDPLAAFDRLFAGQEISANPLDQRRGQIFQALQGEYTSLINRLSTEDRGKIEHHRALIADLENSLTSVISCDMPVRPSPNNGNHIQRYLWRTDSFARMVAAAFSCGVSRVASIGIDAIPPDAYGLAASAAIHHEYEHGTDLYKIYQYFNGSPETSNHHMAADFLRREGGCVLRNVWQTQRLADIADIFANTPDTTGSGSLLDNTLIVYVNEMSNGDHGHEHWPVILLGGFAGGITPGRYIKYAQNSYNPYNRNYFNQYTGTAHTRLYVALCQAFGMNINHLQVPSIPGWVPHRGLSGPVDLSGALSRLRV